MIQQPLGYFDTSDTGNHMERRPPVLQYHGESTLFVDIGPAPEQMFHHRDRLACPSQGRAVKHQAVLDLGAMV